MSRPLGGVLLAASIVGACVPGATEPLDPKGGIAVVTVPSAATRGEPFTTTDGWSVRVESLVVLAWFNGVSQPLPEDALARDPSAYGEGSEWLFHAAEPVSGVVRALRTGPALAGATLGLTGVGPSPERRMLGRDIDPALVARFARVADGERPEDCADPVDALEPRFCYTTYAPSLYLNAIATKEGRTVRVDAGISTVSWSDEAVKLPVVVQADVFAPVDVALDAAALFTSAAGLVVFDDLAQADLDGDGIVSGRELRRTAALFQPSRAAAPMPDDTPAEPPRLVSMLGVIVERSAKMFAPSPR